MKDRKFEKIAEEALFCVEPSSYDTTITAYDAAIAHQTIVFAWGRSLLEQPRGGAEDTEEPDEVKT